MKQFTATDLAVHSSKAAIAQAGLAADKISETFMGSVLNSSLDAAYMSRHVALRSGVGIPAPSLTINRLWFETHQLLCSLTDIKIYFNIFYS